MPISMLPLFNPRPLSGDEVSPFGGVIGKAIDTRKSMADLLKQEIANRLQSARAQYAPELAEGEKNKLFADILAQQISNKTEGAKAEYAPEFARAGLEQAQALPGQTRANTGYLQAETKFLPLKNLIDAQNSARASNRFGPTFQLARMLTQMPPATRAAWISQNQDAYTQMLTDLGNASADQKQNKGQNFLTPELLKNFYPEMNNQPQQQDNKNYALNPNQINSLAQPGNPVGAQMQNDQQPSIQMQNLPLPDNTQQNPKQIKQQTELATSMIKSSPQFQDATPEQHEQIEGALNLEANRKMTTSAMNNRAESSVALDKWLMDNRKEYAPRLQQISKYAGIVGKTKKGWDKLMAETPEAYENYKWFTQAFIPNLDNQIKQMEKMGATDAQRQELTSMLGGAINDWAVNPESSIRLTNKVIKTMGEIGKGIRSAAEPIFKGSYEKTYGIKPIPNDYIPEASSGEKNGNAIQMQDSNGKVWNIPKDKVDALLKKHPDFKKVS